MNKYQKFAYCLLFGLAISFLPFSLCYSIGIMILQVSWPSSIAATGILAVLLLCVHLYRYVTFKIASGPYKQEIQWSLLLIQRLRPAANSCLAVTGLAIVFALVRANL